MPTILEVEPELVSKIQPLARERGVSVDVYLRELMDQKETESERSNGLSSQERVHMLRGWASGRSTNTPVLSDEPLAAKASTEIVAKDVLRKKDRSNADLGTATAHQPLLYK